MSRMPVVFIGHGSPMNAIEDNYFTRNWKEIAAKIPTPKSIISISAHWYTKGTKIMDESNPKTIYDMYGFPKELYEIIYNSPGNPPLAHVSMELISKESVFDQSWGIDHGTWSVLVHMYPEGNIPLFQISVDALASPEVHYQIGQELRSLRDEGVLIFGSGNIVHNLRILDPMMMEDGGYDWAYQFDKIIKDNILSHNHDAIINYKQYGEMAKLAIPITDHFDPILYILGASHPEDRINVYNERCVLGSLSMTSYLFESE